MLMGSLFKRGEDVARLGSKAPWSIKYRTLDGRWRRERVSSEKVVARQKLALIERELARAKVGLGDPYCAQRRLPIEEHVAAFTAAMESGALRSRRRRGLPTRAYVRQSRTRLERAIAEMGIRTLADLGRGERAERILRHSDIRTTMRHYTHLDLQDLARGVERLERAPTNPRAGQFGGECA